MPLFKGCGCKAKPAKAIDYITDEKKAAIVTSYALDDNRDYARQFAETAQLFHKAQRYDSRKYYHFKHSFDPKDNITPEEAHRLTEELAQQAFPDNEYLIATHTDKHHVHCHIIVNSVSFVNGKMLHYSNSDYAKLHVHCHIIVNSVSFVNGKMLHYSNSDYAKLKDLSNEIAAKYGYSTLDFRKQSDDRIKSEERRVVLKGGTSWKEELREVIAEAIKLCNNMTEFEKHLNKYGVRIARNTAKTISFLHPNKKKPIRGSKLGKTYTKEAIIHEFAKHGNRTAGTCEGTTAQPESAKQAGARKQSAQGSVSGIHRAVENFEARTKQLFAADDREDERLDKNRRRTSHRQSASQPKPRRRVK